MIERRSDLATVSIGEGRKPGTVLVTETGPAQDTAQEYATPEDSTGTPTFVGLDVDEYLHDPNTGLLIGAVLSDGGAIFFDPTLQRHYDAARKAFPGLQVTLKSFSADFRRMVVMTDGGDDPGTFWLVDVGAGKAQDLMSAYPTIQPKDVGATHLFPFKASDGLAMDGVLTLPPGSTAKNLPLVLMPHGGPIGFRDRVGFDYWPQAFASRGYAVFQPNYRGSSGHGAAFRQAGYGEWGHRMLSDMSDGVAALASAGIIDKSRVCVVGASYGGYAALASVTFQHGAFRCAVSVSGVSDVGAMMASWGDYSGSASGRYAQAMFGAAFSGDPRLQQISPLRHAAEADAPILIIHGKDDTVVPFVQSLGMNTMLAKAAKSVKFLPLDSEDHWWSHEATRVQILEASVAFVQEHNPVP
jgi:dipeptidyl aminopeptidase/acylaminoacyl peptidase